MTSLFSLSQVVAAESQSKRSKKGRDEECDASIGTASHKGWVILDHSFELHMGICLIFVIPSGGMSQSHSQCDA